MTNLFSPRNPESTCSLIKADKGRNLIYKGRVLDLAANYLLLPFSSSTSSLHTLEHKRLTNSNTPTHPWPIDLANAIVYLLPKLRKFTAVQPSVFVRNVHALHGPVASTLRPPLRVGEDRFLWRGFFEFSAPSVKEIHLTAHRCVVSECCPCSHDPLAPDMQFFKFEEYENPRSVTLDPGARLSHALARSSPSGPTITMMFPTSLPVMYATQADLEIAHVCL